MNNIDKHGKHELLQMVGNKYVYVTIVKKYGSYSFSTLTDGIYKLWFVACSVFFVCYLPVVPFSALTAGAWIIHALLIYAQN